MTELYKFNEDDVYRFANLIGAKTRRKGDQLEFLVCPYCKGGSHHDKSTFHISLNTGQFECKRSSCSVRGNMVTLAKDFSGSFELSNDVSIYHNINGRRNRFKKFKNAKRQIEVRDPAIDYMKSRGISEEITRKYEITVQPENENVLVFPFKDENGELAFVKYRNLKPEPDKAKEWCIAGDYKKILFGMNQCEDFTTLVITEGQIDSLSCAEAGIKNAVSVPTGKNGFTWKPNVWDWLIKFDEIVVFGDNENGEITLAEEITKFSRKRVRVVRSEDYRGCKDANELLQKHGKEAVVEAVKNAETKSSLRIKDVSQVESVDLSKIKAYPTMVPELDEAIGGGFHEGELIVLTGKCGEGKSTFASQMVARMLQAGLKCFCYSGELPDYMFKAWIDSQICGTTSPSEAQINAANDFYKGRLFLFDHSNDIDEDSELIPIMDKAVKDYGCKFILIDNLMTAMEGNQTTDIFRQQSAFVLKLANYAVSNGVIIMLIAHPKKGDGISNDSVSGSGDITNRANLVLRYQKINNDPDSYISKLMVTKNRINGQLRTDDWAIKVEYEPKSRRIGEVGKSFVPFYGGKEVESGFAPVEEDYEVIPF